jgi:hypothetical protein
MLRSDGTIALTKLNTEKNIAAENLARLHQDIEGDLFPVKKEIRQYNSSS